MNSPFPFLLFYHILSQVITAPQNEYYGVSNHQRSTLKEKAREAMNHFKSNMDNKKKRRNSYGYENGRNNGQVGEEEEERVQERDSTTDRNVMIGDADMSDRCFARYSNVIVVNAQPYERRSRLSLVECKTECSQSRDPLYSCLSFVYDHVHLVCDLFAHTGDRPPARLLKFQSRDYFEPTNEDNCNETIQRIATPIPLARSAETDMRGIGETNNATKLLPITSPFTHIPPQGTTCPTGRIARFLKTEGFELYESDDKMLEGLTLDECIDACDSNTVEGLPFSCRSFDFSNSMCSLSSEGAVPLGNGQLKEKSDSSYYEKICVDENTTKDCQRVFHRFPQMILVGFAETVTDSPLFENCLERCLNSYQLYGFNCTSGMFYFEEHELNCILNSENRQSQSDLFAEENTDIVDYFDVSCTRTTRRAKALGVKSLNRRSENLVLAPSTNTQWSECENGRQHRRMDCGVGVKGDECGLQSRECNDNRKTFHCPDGACCGVFGGCQVGLRHNPHTKRLQWCRDPCNKSKRN